MAHLHPLRHAHWHTGPQLFIRRPLKQVSDDGQADIYGRQDGHRRQVPGRRILVACHPERLRCDSFDTAFQFGAVSAGDFDGYAGAARVEGGSDGVEIARVDDFVTGNAI